MGDQIQAGVGILAYIDPGSGLMVWQAIVAGFMGTVFSVKKSRGFLAKIGRKLLGRREP